MENVSVALMISGEPASTRNALTEDRYKNLAMALSQEGFLVESVLYHDSRAEELSRRLERFQVVLVWVNPLEQGRDRQLLDTLLRESAQKHCFVSAHPDIILKIGTKEVLYSTRHMDWGGDTEIYGSPDEFRTRFPSSLRQSGARILKQYRGNGGNGVFKVRLGELSDENVRVVHAKTPDDEREIPIEAFSAEFKKYFEKNDVLISQHWNPQIVNGMVRCYLTGTRVSGFGYQEANALCPRRGEPDSKIRPVSKRFYFSEECGLFQDLRSIMERRWVPELQAIHDIPDKLLPLLWDADFFINDVNTNTTEKKYTLCEINASSVSPFPDSCVQYVVEDLKRRFLE